MLDFINHVSKVLIQWLRTMNLMSNNNNQFQLFQYTNVQLEQILVRIFKKFSNIHAKNP